MCVECLQMSAHRVRYDSPPPHSIRRSRESPSPVSSPASALNYSDQESMPPKKKPLVTWQDCVDFFRDHISDEDWELAERNGALFHYNMHPMHKYAKDGQALKAYSSIVLAHLKIHPHGLFTRKNIEKALTFLSNDKRRKIDSKTPIDFQAFNYCRLFSDIRHIKGSTTTGARLASHVKMLCDAMDIAIGHTM